MSTTPAPAGPLDEPLDAELLPTSAPSELPALQQSRLLNFYDRLRQRVLGTVEKKAGKLGEQTAQALLLVPDVFMLLVRLMLDREVPERSRALIGGALLYFVLPFDLWPEALVGPAGFMDDLVLAIAVLANTFDPELERHALKHWSGSQDLHSVLQNLTAAGRGLLGEGLYGRLRRLLSRRGVNLDDPSHEATGARPSTTPG